MKRALPFLVLALVGIGVSVAPHAVYACSDPTWTYDEMTGTCLPPADSSSDNMAPEVTVTAKRLPKTDTSGSSISGQTSGSNSSSYSSVGGQTTGCSSGTTGLTNPLKTCDLMELIKEILTIVARVATALLTLMLIYVGFLFVQARGNAEKLTQARTALQWTVIGGLVLIGAAAIANVIAATASSL